ncbi:helix-turn-helix transcriptional regulator [Lactococcus protaetiae]|uniref:Helix-turn-helix transcriptional regulator n=1 Tax=Lactococcus protaetiae TaxID=2592653 RepID=A0A514Z829_9LACT|nr:helix-turn-helix transcriptional regulator [Lactococcus protaetiae]QDK70735.1 helix-turn-helix transcriptional regulator [Lactococcus protaetiae]
MVTIAERLSDLRHMNNLTQNQVCDALGLTERTYIRYERGQTKPDTELLIRFSEFYNKNLFWILGLTEQMEIFNFVMDVLEQNAKYGDSNGLRSRACLEYMEQCFVARGI